MTEDEVEDLESFRTRARGFIRANLGPARSDATMRGLRGGRSDDEELAHVRHDQALQRMFFDAGLAGICFPREYGGQGLSPAHQAVLNEELVGYEHPSHLQVPSISQCGAVILDFASEEQKRRHVPTA